MLKIDRDSEKKLAVIFDMALKSNGIEAYNIIASLTSKMEVVETKEEKKGNKD